MQRLAGVVGDHSDHHLAPLDGGGVVVPGSGRRGRLLPRAARQHRRQQNHHGGDYARPGHLRSCDLHLSFSRGLEGRWTSPPRPVCVGYEGRLLRGLKARFRERFPKGFATCGRPLLSPRRGRRRSRRGRPSGGARPWRRSRRRPCRRPRRSPRPAPRPARSRCNPLRPR